LGDHLKPIVRQKLLLIAEKFYESLDLVAPIKDIRFLGSAASYSYNTTSDIDLHIVIDFNDLECDPELLRELVNAKKNLFNNNRKIEIHGFEVEVYVEDINDDNKSDAIYSVKHGRWIRKSSPTEITPDKSYIRKVYNSFERHIENLEEIPSPIKRLDQARKIKDQLYVLRKKGLSSKKKNFSDENLAFKTLRGRGKIKKLREIIVDTGDEILSLMDNK
jgi:predicted nucleotidyltransferase